jgi:hypothetical protein
VFTATNVSTKVVCVVMLYFFCGMTTTLRKGSLHSYAEWKMITEDFFGYVGTRVPDCKPSHPSSP